MRYPSKLQGAFMALLLALCLGGGLQGQSVLDVQAMVN